MKAYGKRFLLFVGLFLAGQVMAEAYGGIGGAPTTSFAAINQTLSQAAAAAYSDSAVTVPVTASLMVNGVQTSQYLADSDVTNTPLQISWVCSGSSAGAVALGTVTNGFTQSAQPGVEGFFQAPVSDPTTMAVTNYTLYCNVQAAAPPSGSGSSDPTQSQAQPQPATPVTVASAQATVQVVWVYHAAGGPNQTRGVSAAFVQASAAQSCRDQMAHEAKGCEVAKTGLVSGYELKQLGLAVNTGSCDCPNGSNFHAPYYTGPINAPNS
jgi:hypothetical protein